MGTVLLYATLRPRADGERAVEIPWSSESTVLDVVRELVRRKPGLDGYILDEDEEVLRFVNIFLNGRDVRYLNGMQTRVDGETEIAIFPAVAGG